MKPKFKGFLKRYCMELSGEHTASLRKLCKAAAEDAPRVAEPLFLLAFEQGKLDYLLTLSRGAWMERDYLRLAESAGGFSNTEEFLLRSETVSERYRSVLDAFHADDDLLAADRRMNDLMRKKTLEALRSSGITRYRLCEELGLNKGNVYAYLAGDPSKVSRKTARMILDYAQAV